MKTTKQKVYASPKTEVIAIEPQGVLCTSWDESANAGGGTTNMGINSGYGW